MKKILLTLPLLVFSQANAVTTVTASLTGNMNVKILDEEHFDNNAKCYPGGKGTETHDLGQQTLTLNGGEQTGSFGQLFLTPI
jgi:hypothetical protein